MCIEHLWTVASLQRGHTTGDGRRSASNVMGSGPLFQYRNYQEQESLQLNSKEISVIVDTVCSSQSIPEESIWGDMGTYEVWQTGGKSIGHACVTILIKLIMDMYIEHGANVAYMLVLQMLHTALHSADVSVRLRVFDVIYNLSLHSLMMSNTADASFFEKSETAEDAEKEGSRPPFRDAHSPEKSSVIKLQTLNEEAASGVKDNKERSVS